MVRGSASSGNYSGPGDTSGSSRRYGWLGFVLFRSLLSVNAGLMQRMFIQIFSVVGNTMIRINSTTVSAC